MYVHSIFIHSFIYESGLLNRIFFKRKKEKFSELTYIMRERERHMYIQTYTYIHGHIHEQTHGHTHTQTHSSRSVYCFPTLILL